MMQELKRYQVNVFGESYTILSDQTESDVNETVELIDSMMKELVSKSSNIDIKKAAIFVALQIASKIKTSESESKQVEKRHNLLIHQIDDFLSM